MKYEYTDFDLVLANHHLERANGEPCKWALATIHVFTDGDGVHKIGHYTDMGIVAEGDEYVGR